MITGGVVGIDSIEKCISDTDVTRSVSLPRMFEV